MQQDFDGIPGAVDWLEAALRGLDRLTPAELAAAVAELAYRTAAEAARDGLPPLEHILVRDSLAGALASIGYARQAQAIAARPMPPEPGGCAEARLIRAVDAARAGEGVEVVATRGDDVLANAPGARGQLRGRVAFRASDAVSIRDAITRELVNVPAGAIVRNFSRNPETGAR